MGKAPFRFSKDILLRLGEELNPSPDQSILELVKNSYDADARKCLIELIDTDLVGGTIKVTDDGDGLDDHDIINGWLVVGRSPKSQIQRTRLGRIPSGNKGLGRLSALRMGSKVDLVSSPNKHPGKQFSLKIDWAEYEKVDLVDDVSFNIIEKKITKKRSCGTEIKIEKLRHKISALDAKKLSRALILLADPFGDDPEGFSPQLRAPEFANLEKLVKKRYFEDAEYCLSAKVNEKGQATATVKDWRGNELFQANHKELNIKNKNKRYNCPSAIFDFWVYILDKQLFLSRASTLKEVREWLQKLGGVHVYQNGLRVSPYGNEGNDWLDLNLRRVRSPEERPGTNTSIGRISVYDENATLVQKTDRSGFIETEGFLELKKFAVDTLEWMAKRRLEVAEKRRKKERIVAPKKSNIAKVSMEKAIEKASNKNKPALKTAFKSYDKSRETELKSLRKEVQLYRTLSTAGITAATFAHESTGNPIKVISNSINALAYQGKKAYPNEYDGIFKKPIALIKRSVEAIKVLGATTLSLVDHEKRRIGRVEVHKVIRSIVSIYKPFLRDREVTIKLELLKKNPYLRGADAAIESIITNLLNNSLAWFEGTNNNKRKIIIRTVIEDGILIIRVIDNGPGIEGIGKNDIWLPGQTTRPNGTGLGLTIVHDTVKDLAGDVDIIEHGEIGGAEFIIKLPIIGA